MSGRWFLPVLAVVIAAAAVSCGTSSEDERAALCEDLGNLAATVELIANPPVDATVGQVRGAIEKLDPTIEQVQDAGVVPDVEADGLRDDQETALDALRGIGDETPIVEVSEDRVTPTDAVAATYRNLFVSLGCPAQG